MACKVIEMGSDGPDDDEHDNDEEEGEGGEREREEEEEARKRRRRRRYLEPIKREVKLLSKVRHVSLALPFSRLK